MDKRTRLYEELREASRAEIARRVETHKLETARIHYLHKQLRALKKPLPQVPLDFLAIGDSWFNYPLDGNILAPLPTNFAIVADWQLGAMGNPPPRILSQAMWGQATTAVLSYENQQAMINVLQDPNQWLNQQTGLPDAILISAGGDDLVGDQFAIYLDYGGGGGLNQARFQGALDSVKASYMDLFAFRDIFAKDVPIIGHCYDYAIPNGIHPLCVPRGWLWPSLNFAGYDYNAGLGIVTQMIDQFHGMLNNLAASKANNFVFVDTRSTLTRNASYPNGWANEIHPYPTGFTALANKFLIALRAMPAFKNRI